MTLNNLIDLLRKIAGNHPQINEFGIGDIAEIGASKDVTYPLMWSVLQPSRYSNKQLYVNLQLVFADLIFDDKKNELEVQSDQLSIALDIVAQLRENPEYDFQVDGDASIAFFSDRLNDLCAGVTVAIVVRLPRPLDRCVIPA